MGTQKFFRKSLTVPKTVAQCRKHPTPYLNTCITYLNTLIRLAAPYLNTLTTRLGSRQPIRTEYYVTRVGKNPTTSSANQNQVLR